VNVESSLSCSRGRQQRAESRDQEATGVSKPQSSAHQHHTSTDHTYRTVQRLTRAPELLPTSAMVPPSLHRLVVSRDWGSIRAVEHRTIGSRSSRYSDKKMALQAAIRINAPADIVRFLLRINSRDITFDCPVSRDGRREGCSPLHVAAMYFPSSHVVDALLEANPDSCLAKDQYGSTPLHLAALLVGGNNMSLLSKASNIRYFVSAVLALHPDAAVSTDAKGNTPLHRIARWSHHRLWGMTSKIAKAFLDAAPESANVVNRAGQEPLLHAIHFRAPFDVVRPIIESHPDVLTTYNGRYSILSFLCKSWFELSAAFKYTESLAMPLKDFRHALLDHFGNSEGTDNNIVSLTISNIKNNGYSTPYSIALQIIRSSTATGIDRGLELHWMARNPAYCPKLILRLGYCLGQLGIEDSNGDLPLHVIARTPPDTSGANEPFPLSEDALALCPIEEMIRIRPSATRVVDRKGDLPLRLAISAGRGWKSGVRDLLKAHPAALHDEDTLPIGAIPHILGKVAQENDLGFMLNVVREAFKIQGITSKVLPPSSPAKPSSSRKREILKIPKRPTKVLRKSPLKLV